MKDIMNIAVVNFESVWGNVQCNLKRMVGYIERGEKRSRSDCVSRDGTPGV